MTTLGETPGLGARITTLDVQSRYVGKKIKNDNGDYRYVKMLKGENNKDLSVHEVDGMSGATITGNGVNDMIKDYVTHYKNFISNLEKDSSYYSGS